MQLHAVDDTPDFEKPWMKDYKFHLVDTIDKLKKLVDICISKNVCSLDLETTGVDNRVYPDEYFGDGIKTRHGMRTIDRIVGVCISFDGKNGYYVPLSHEPEGSNNLPWDPAWDELERLVHSKSKLLYHNSKFDCEFLYPVTNKEYWKIDEYEDTFFIAKILNPIKTSPSGLKALTKQHFNVEMIELNDLFTDEMREQLKREKRSLYNFGVLHPKEGLAYGCSDGIFTYLLYFKIQEMMSEGDRKIYNLEKSFCNVLRKLERNRVHIDVKALNKLNDDATEAIQTLGDKIRQAIESWTGKTTKWLTLNLGSPKQLSEVFITDPEGLRLKPTSVMLKELEEGGGFGNKSDEDDDSPGPSNDMPSGNIVYSTKDEALKSLKAAYGKKYLVDIGHKDADGNPKLENVFELIIEYRHYMKLKGSYTEPLSLAVDKNGDVRPDFRQLGTDTARLSSRAGEIEQGYAGINFQGIPRDSDDDKPELFKKIRSVIVPREGYALVKLDFAGEELRVVTNLSGDPIWTDSFLNKDGDVHAITAKTLFAKDSVSKDERNRGKRCNFAFIYGGGAGAIQRNIDCTMEDAQRHMANLKRDVPVLMGYVDHQKEYAKKHKAIFTAFGRRIPIPTIDSPIKMIRSKAERCAINYTIQATSADILKFAMCFVDKNIRAMGWENDVRYVLTVHDEVVYEIKPHLLMEAVRKLDEWMTMPWKLPKAHGRDWVVPLLTEPGIDVNWKARYDYFKMVDGVPADPKALDVDGKFIGKLKKDEFFLDGRIYQ
jgi:DNA polymerase I-like protein with 3'-5' exonuclease and polymerase domains